MFVIVIPRNRFFTNTKTYDITSIAGDPHRKDNATLVGPLLMGEGIPSRYHRGGVEYHFTARRRQVDTHIFDLQY